MDWKRIKAFIIVVMLLVNVFLGCIIYAQYNSLYRISKETIAYTVSLLSGEHMWIKEDAIPREKTNAKVFTGTFDREKYEEAIVRRFPISEKVHFLGETDIEYAISRQYDKAYVEMLMSILGNHYNKEEYKIQKQVINRFLTVTDYQGEVYDGLSYKITRECFNTTQRVYIASVTQTLNGIEICGNDAILMMNSEDIVYFSGRWFFGTPEEQYTVSLIDQVSVLFNENQNIKIKNEQNPSETPSFLDTVNQVEECYCFYWNSEMTDYYLIPAWKISYGSGCYVVYNAVSGNIYSEKKVYNTNENNS